MLVVYINFKSVDCMRDLGTYITNDLSFSTHINNIVSKANMHIGFLLKRFCFLKIRKSGKLEMKTVKTDSDLEI